MDNGIVYEDRHHLRMQQKEHERALMQQKGRHGASVQNDRGYSRSV
ncbi:hypothetical protein HanRHA438_Chr14g0649421 [Helianthus annuus]|nr:hypothetical protein HanRHA438_Chr14g0649421 [Helianthus annuus]